MRQHINLFIMLLCWLTSPVVLGQEVSESLLVPSKLPNMQYTNQVGETETFTIMNPPSKSGNSGFSQTSSSGVGETLGTLSVSLTGAATYTVPIMVPPGINGVEPQLAITYNSQAGSGLAGWGWNVSGTSAITRIPSTEYHDGEIDPVDFDRLDRFALNGQRLILKSGTYGGDGAVYETEDYSNIKVVSEGVSIFGEEYGPSHFMVYYPDGSVARYGANIISRLQYAISYMENPQKIRIVYDYEKVDAEAEMRIKSIRYGSRGSASPINKVEFIYGNRSQRETTFISGFSFVRKSILKEINVLGNGTGYRNYIIEHGDVSATSFDKLTSIQEFSGDNSESHSKISFSYPTPEYSIKHTPVTSTLNLGNLEQRNAEVVPMDLTGNGKMDFIVYPKPARDKLYVFSEENYSQAYPMTNIGEFETIIPTTFLNAQNKINTQQGFTVVQNRSDKKVDLKVFAKTTFEPFGQHYKKTWNAPTATNQSWCGQPSDKTIAPLQYLSGDFDGDGLTDVVAINRSYSSTICTEYTPPPGEPCPLGLSGTKNTGPDKNNRAPQAIPDCCRCTTSSTNSSRVYLIDLDPTKINNFVKSTGFLRRTLNSQDRLRTGDVNGDGKADILHITQGKVEVYTINKNGTLSLLWETSDSKIKNNLPILLGDYNGDGKTDLLIPNANNSKTFHYFFSYGNKFISRQQTMPFEYKENIWNGTNGVYSGFTLIPLDIDGDGRTDIIDYKTITYSSGADGEEIVRAYFNIHRYSKSIPEFVGSYGFEVQRGIKLFPIPIYWSSENPNYGLEFATISDNKISSFSFTHDHNAEMRFYRTDNNKVVHEIKYGPMDPSIFYDGIPIYQTGTDQVYPYVDIPSARGFNLVRQISREGIDFDHQPEKVYRDFYYKSAVTHLEGMGFMGFEQVAQSNWYTSNSDRIFTNTKRDIQLRGAVVDQFQTPNFYRHEGPGTDYIQKTHNTYEHTFSASKVLKLQLVTSTMQDKLLGTTTTSHFEYDNSNNPTKQTTNYSGHGSTVTAVTYSNSTGSTYYIGRPTSKKITATISSNSFSTEERYTYSGYLLTKKETKGNGTNWNAQTFQYDTFGNILKTTVTPYGETSRVTSSKYDTSGRFITESVDVEGLKTMYKFDTNNGTLLETTDPYGNKTKYKFDPWYREIEMTDYLGNRSTTSYVENNFHYTVTRTGADGGVTSSYYDPLQRKVNDRYKGLNGAWRQVDYRYDKFDRLVRQSEPHTGAPSQWNETEYDFYGRIKSQTLYTGRVITYSYQGLAVTVDDGAKVVTTTKNAVGNVVRVDDPGGTIFYSYFGNGNLKGSLYNGSAQLIYQDGWGRKTKLIDPSAGTYEYEYNGFGEMTKEITPKGNTTYTYSNTGRILQEKVQGDETNMTVDYNYYENTKLLSWVHGFDDINDENHYYSYTYDQYKRLTKINESMNGRNFIREDSYDQYGRLDLEKYTVNLGGNNSTAEVSHVYDSYGNHKGQIGYSIEKTNARGQVTEAITAGNQDVKNEYDSYGYLTKTTVEGRFTGEDKIENLYSFNAQRGTLNSRSQKTIASGHNKTYSESFTYDNLDRLTDVSGDRNYTYQYDTSGRITNDSFIGDYIYQSGNKKYQLKGLDLNVGADFVFANQAPRAITYNAHKKPVEIYNRRGGNSNRVAFEYGPFKNRTRAWYGGGDSDKYDLRYHKYYSSIAPVEVIHDTTENTYKLIFFLGGDAYSAPIAKIEKFKDGTKESSDLMVLQRDYQGSILNILRVISPEEDEDYAEIVERRQYEAWGNVVGFWSKDRGTFEEHNNILDRGYTGHEHFMEVRLIHMNGRMYDPDFHVFMSPDNYIQNPYNTQNFNRYSYVLNNPLMYTDYSGEMYGGCPECSNSEGAAGLASIAIMGFSALQDARIGSWLDGAIWTPVKDFFNNLFSGSDDPVLVSIPQSQVSSDPLMNPNPSINPVFTSGSNGQSSFSVLDAGNYLLGLSNSFDQGIYSRTIDIANFVQNDLLRSDYYKESIYNGFNRIVQRRTIFDPSDEYLEEVYSNMSNMSGNDWAFAAGYSATDLALVPGAVGGASYAIGGIARVGTFVPKTAYQFKWLRASGGRINGFTISKGSGYGAKPRLDFHKLGGASKASNTMTIPKFLKNRKLFHWHRGKGNNLRRHRPWEKGWNDKSFWDRF